ncbi:hypothetical protein [Vibrio europaeus]|uniref:Toxin n=1 Tax=Vibrio europaeus TaxID=300876 RepID=A0A178J635_9VIBR|nr:hypothetical protein [Vibrio europaeus]MDC5706162.1 hypothetical protein [Vibrio europaeus]MDC5709572.1 hypothetical protein [Vibrio europaeus]MDC5713971.1 hypothetical protein [Vibrio europaeus]MDC5723420.1 hypothetical protein [Vibrio europaeus]MDC5730557.1 hypothetical protein [Vibrio europaeus]
MRIDKLATLSLLSSAVSKSLRVRLQTIVEALYPKKNKSSIERFVNIYASFIFSQGHQNFNAMNVLNDKGKFQQHVDELVGFIYEEASTSPSSKSADCKCIHKVMCKLALDNNIDIEEQSFSDTKVKGYTRHCIEEYKKLPIDDDKITYLNGWELTSQERKTVPINLDFMYVKYGLSLTDKIHTALKNYALTQKRETLHSLILAFVPFLKTVCALDKEGSANSLERLLNASHVQSTFLKVYHLMLSDCISKNNDIAIYNKQFCRNVGIYQLVFIDTKVYPAPLIQFVTPSVKNVKNPPSFLSGGKPSNIEKMRWFAEIPLCIKDNEAIDVIESRLNRDVSYLKSVLTNHFNDLKAKQDRNRTFINTGRIKPLEGNTLSTKGSEFGQANEIGSNHLENTIATFYHYGINGCSHRKYVTFLGYRGNTADLEKELNLPTHSTLFTLTALLVMEHPKITPAWLQKLQLYNESGRAVGYFQSGELYILSSEKDRRGRNLSQQDVILNKFSKSIVDYIIEHTALARKFLKSSGSPDWKYLLLTCSVHNAFKPSRGASLYHPSNITLELLNNHAYLPKGYDLSQREVDTIASITTHRAIRRHRILQIYLDTRSQIAVADALGHKKADNQLLASYLPKPMMEFFTERVIRQFQKAIILKAMEESEILLDAMNMTYDEIKEFFDNHGLNEMPDLNAKTFDNAASNLENSLFDSIELTVTTPLIQLLISIKTIVDSDNAESSFNDLVQHWYQCACYLLNRFELGDFASNDEIKEIYETAKETPLNYDIVKRAILC